VRSREQARTQQESIKGAGKRSEKAAKSDRPMQRYLGVALFSALAEGRRRRDDGASAGGGGKRSGRSQR
jgi:hypothetical protein